MVKRNIGVIGDGSTDRLIFIEIVKAIMVGESLENHLNFVELERQSLRVYVDKYWREANRRDEYYLPGEPAKKLQRMVANELTGAFRDFEDRVGFGELSNRDILLVTTDAEKSLNNPELYFEIWAFGLSKILTGAIEEFYRIKITQGYSCEYLPTVITLASFPSTEIFVIAAKDMAQRHYGKKAKDLKRILYGTDNLRTLEDGDLQEKALKFINRESINLVFRHIPEARLFIQTLSFSRCS